jgi:hypothetical protein
MATSPDRSSNGSSAHLSNPFVSAPPQPVSTASLQHVNIRTHVPITLDFTESNFSSWCTFFDATFRKFGISDHIDGTVDAAMMFHDAEWLQIDNSIISWLYNSISSELMAMIQVPEPTASTLWMAIRGLFLDNAMQRTIYVLQEFHNLFQGDMTITAYFGRLKQLADLLRDVGHPISEPSMVVNALRGLNSKFSHAIGVLTAKVPPPSFLYVRN